MCYSWYENAEKTARHDVAQEEPQKTAPEAPQGSRVPSAQSRFWTFRIGRRVPVTEEARVHMTEEAAADRPLEKV